MTPLAVLLLLAAVALGALVGLGLLVRDLTESRRRRTVDVCQAGLGEYRDLIVWRHIHVAHSHGGGWLPPEAEPWEVWNLVKIGDRIVLERDEAATEARRIAWAELPAIRDDSREREA